MELNENDEKGRVIKFDYNICIVCEKLIESDNDCHPLCNIYRTNNERRYGHVHKNCSLDPETKEFTPNLGICLVPEWEQSIWSQLFPECLEEPEIIKKFRKAEVLQRKRKMTNPETIEIFPCGGFSYEYIGAGECRIGTYGNIKHITVSDYEISAGFKTPIKDRYSIQMRGTSPCICDKPSKNENGFKIMLNDDKKKIRLEKSIKVAILPFP